MIKTFAEAQDVLAASLPGYTRRPHQMALAAQVEQAIANRETILANAGCGTGKSLGALIPLIINLAIAQEQAKSMPMDPEHPHPGRAIVATATKALQDQYRGDLTFLREHLGIEFKHAIIKGRSNYPCHLRISELKNPSIAQRRIIRLVEDPERNGEVIDRESFSFEFTNPEWNGVSTSAADCPGRQHCPFGSTCIAEAAKAKAADAGIVVTNASYLLQDLILRRDSDNSVALLGDYDHLLIDEAHELGDKATDALSDSMGVRAFWFLARDIEAFLHDSNRDFSIAARIEMAAQGLWFKLDDLFADANKDNRKKDPVRLTLSDLLNVGDQIEDLINQINEAHAQVRRVDAEKQINDESGHLTINRKWIARFRLLRRSSDWSGRLANMLISETLVRWLEIEVFTDRRSGEREERLMFCSAPLSPAKFLQENMFGPTQTTLMSATLAVGKKGFGYIRSQLGIRDGIQFDAGTPFDFKTQAMLFVPAKGSPEPADQTISAWRSSSQIQTRMLVEAADGNALLLFTSNENMNAAWDALAPGFIERGLRVLKQGSGPAQDLIAQLKTGNTVLFGLKTFFVGVDVQGEACRLVVIDKLPFTPPTDVLYKARCEQIVKERGEWTDFRDLAIPSMSLLLIQGVGRLIRHASDRGVMAVLDPRLKSKGYGTTILNSMPDAPVTTDIREAMAFLKKA